MTISNIERKIIQLGLIVRDAEQTVQHFRDVLGFTIPEGSEITKTGDEAQATYHGAPLSGRAKIITFDIGDIQFELIEPLNAPSVWHDFLEQNGEGLHHVALFAQNSDEAVKLFEQLGYSVIQEGLFGDPSGQYTYLDTDRDLGIVFELLEHYDGKPQRDPAPHPDDKGIGTDVVTQVGIIVRDIEATAQRYSEVFGIAKPDIINVPGYELSKTTYHGQRCDATCKLAFFDFGQVTIELIEPDAISSVWRDWLEENGEGAQHIAFQIKGTQKVTDYLASHDIPISQQGLYADASGMYTYVHSADKLGIDLELLENF